MSNSAKNKYLALAVIELRLSEGISKWVSELVSQSVEIELNRNFLKLYNNFLKWVRNDLKIFWAWLCLTYTA